MGEDFNAGIMKRFNIKPHCVLVGAAGSAAAEIGSGNGSGSMGKSEGEGKWLGQAESEQRCEYLRRW